MKTKETPTHTPPKQGVLHKTKAEVDATLDEALEESFPASDPVSINPPGHLTHPAETDDASKNKKRKTH